MQVVIKISERIYKKLAVEKEENIPWDYVEKIITAITYGTPLPKGHGKLIDADAYLTKERPRGIDEDMWKESHIYKSITGAPTIIEADKESEG